jgi:hypothetical protein
MKEYKILVASVTGVKGKQLTEGTVHAETEFVTDNIPDLLEAQLIAEHVEEEKKESTSTKKSNK